MESPRSRNRYRAILNSWYSCVADLKNMAPKGKFDSDLAMMEAVLRNKTSMYMAGKICHVEYSSTLYRMLKIINRLIDHYHLQVDKGED